MGELSFSVDVVTPEGRLFEGLADFIVVPAHDGEMGFLYHRAPVMGTLGEGEMRIHVADSGLIEHFAVQGGFVGTDGEKIVVLASRAQHLSNYDRESLLVRLAGLTQRLADLEALDGEEPDPEIPHLNDEISWVRLVIRLV
jgi:F-type H+-transporting ATPase subunit epsilon